MPESEVVMVLKFAAEKALTAGRMWPGCHAKTV